MAANALVVVGIDITTGGRFCLLHTEDRILRAEDNTVVALETHTATHAALGLCLCLLLIQSVHTLLEVVQHFVGGGHVLGGTAYLLVWGLLRAGTLRPSVALVIALSILTMVSIVGFIVTQTSGEQSTELATLAGMGLGGLAGAVTAVWGEDRRMDTEPPATPPTPDDREDEPVEEWPATEDTAGRPEDD